MPAAVARELCALTPAEEERLCTALDSLKDFDFFALYRVNLFGTCTLLCQADEQCDMRCEVEPVNSASKWLEERDEADFSYVLDGWSRFDPPSEQAEYYSLAMYPETNTGYNGSDVWRVIHRQICFPGTPMGPQGAFNAAVSALHAGISAHIVAGTREDNSGTSPTAEFARRFGGRPEYVDKLHSTRALVLAAVQRFSKDILPIVQKVCGMQPLMVPEIPADTSEYRLRLRELCAVMDCVQCNACRIHGKVAALGLATAFRLLWSDEGERLRRVEVAALLVVLQKLTKALHVISQFQS